MLRGILGFLPLVLDLACIFLGLALNCLSLALSLLAQTHDRLLCVLRRQRCHIRIAFPAGLPGRGAPMTPCSTPGEAQTFQISCRQLFASPAPSQRRNGSGTLEAGDGKGKQPQAAGNAGHATEYRGPCEDDPGRYSRRPVRVRQGRSASRPMTGARRVGARSPETALLPPPLCGHPLRKVALVCAWRGPSYRPGLSRSASQLGSRAGRLGGGVSRPGWPARA